MLKNENIKKLCEDILREIADRHHIIIIELSVMPDHIHMVVSLAEPHLPHHPFERKHLPTLRVEDI